MEKTESIEKGYWSADQAAKYLGFKRSTIYEMVKRGDLPAYNLNGKKRFKKEEIDVWMATHKGNGISAYERRNRVLETIKGARASGKLDIDGLVRDAIEEATKNSYNGDHGNQTKVKGLGKEVNNGDL